MLKYYVIGIAAGVLLTFEPYLFILGACGLLIGYLFIFRCAKPQDRNFVFGVFAASFLVRALLAFGFFLISLLKGGDGFLFTDDGIDASYNAVVLASLWHNNIFPTLEEAKSFCPSTRLTPYHFWNTFVYYFTNWNPLFMFLINCVIGSLSLVFVYRIAKDIFNSQVAKISVGLFAFWPSILLWSTMNSKEPLTIFLILLAVFCGIKLRDRISAGFLILAAIPVYLILIIRTPVVALLVALAIILHFTFSYRKKESILLAVLILGGIILMLVIFPPVHSLVWNSVSVFAAYGRNFFEAINYSHNILAMDAESIFLPGVDISSPLKAAAYLPLALVYVVFSPFPWIVTSFSSLLGSFEMLLFYALLPFMVIGAVLSIKERRINSLLLVIFIVLYSLALAFLEGNVGTLFRHRSHMLPFCLILASFGIYSLNRKCPQG